MIKLKDTFYESIVFLAQKCAINNFIHNYDFNYDFGHFGDTSKDMTLPPQYRLETLSKNLRQLSGKQREEYVMEQVTQMIMPYSKEYDWVFNRLGDDESKVTLLQTQLYKALGPLFVKMSLNTIDYWRQLKTAERLVIGTDSLDLGFRGWKVWKINMESLGYPLVLYFHPPGVLNQFLLQPYRCKLEHGVIEVEEGDVVIDGGGCYGETALYFALKAGQTGEIFSFEFMPENLAFFHKNMSLNEEMAKKVKLITKGLWSESAILLSSSGSGPAARLSPDTINRDEQKVATLSIDDLLLQNNVPRVDFIKMDIEGAELEALKGGEMAIKKYKPKLAISIYHKPEDIWEIPQYLDSIKPDYKFYMRHFTIHSGETVLFAS